MVVFYHLEYQIDAPSLASCIFADSNSYSALYLNLNPPYLTLQLKDFELILIVLRYFDLLNQIETRSIQKHITHPKILILQILPTKTKMLQHLR